ncbi:HNH endonuclease signature motif containing protein [Mycoplasma sp. 613B]
MEKNLCNKRKFTILVSKSLFSNLTKEANKEESDKLYSDIKLILSLDKKIDINDEVEWKNTEVKFQGLVIEELNELIYFTQKLGENGKPKSRNTYIMQNFLPVLLFSYENNIKNISVSLHPLDLFLYIEEFPKTILKDFKIFSTLGVKINYSLTSRQKNNLNTKFENIKHFQLEKENLKRQNKRNLSSYIEYDELKKEIKLYAKFDGANASDSLISAIVINKIFEKDKDIKRKLLILKTNEKLFEIKQNLLKILKQNNFEVNKQPIFSQPIFDITHSEEDLKRNQPLFKENIKIWYCENNLNPDKCLVCGYQFSEHLISAHIHRVSDVKNEFKNNKISFDDANKLIVEGCNGFLLCPTCDKEFEWGKIFFDLNLYKFFSNPENKYITETINITTNKEKFEENIKKHLVRIKNLSK